MQRSRKPSASLSVVALNQPQQPAPPAELTIEQAEVWRATVEAMRADWFGRETWPLLSQFCRHVVIARRVAKLIDGTNATIRLNMLLAMQVRESAAIATLSTRMRLRQESPRDAKTTRRVAHVRKPWERDA
jgi:hypothetical protein